MSDNLPVFGFAGTANPSGDLISANLFDSMPEECLFVLPDNISRGKSEDAGLRNVRAWIQAEYDTDDLEKSPDVLESLIRYSNQDHETTLVLLYTPGTDDHFLRAAVENHITVLDLNQAMMELSWREPEPEPAPVTRQRGVPREPEDAQPAIAPEAVTMETIVRIIVREELEAMGLVPGANKPILAQTQIHADPAGRDLGPQADFNDEAAELLEEQSPWEADDKPPAPTRKYTVDESGTYRPRKPGRLASGLRQVELTDTQADALREAGSLRDE